MSPMMAATQSRQEKSDELLEDEFIRRAEVYLKKRKAKKAVPEVQEKVVEEKGISGGPEIPFAEIEPLPIVARENEALAEQKEKRVYKNKAELQDDERDIVVIKEALKNLVNITIEDLLNISDLARQELKKWLTKKRVEKMTISLLNEGAENVIHAENLPC